MVLTISRCRLVRPLVADVAVVAKCHLSSLYRHDKGKLFGQLVDLLQYYEGFEIDDHQGRQMTDDEVLQAHYRRLQAFQLLAFKKIPKVCTVSVEFLHLLFTLSRTLNIYILNAAIVSL